MQDSACSRFDQTAATQGRILRPARPSCSVSTRRLHAGTHQLRVPTAPWVNCIQTDRCQPSTVAVEGVFLQPRIRCKWIRPDYVATRAIRLATHRLRIDRRRLHAVALKRAVLRPHIRRAQIHRQIPATCDGHGKRSLATVYLSRADMLRASRIATRRLRMDTATFWTQERSEQSFPPPSAGGSWFASDQLFSASYSQRSCRFLLPCIHFEMYGNFFSPVPLSSFTRTGEIRLKSCHPSFRRPFIDGYGSTRRRRRTRGLRVDAIRGGILPETALPVCVDGNVVAFFRKQRGSLTFCNYSSSNSRRALHAAIAGSVPLRPTFVQTHSRLYHRTQRCDKAFFFLFLCLPFFYGLRLVINVNTPVHVKIMKHFFLLIMHGEG